MKPRAHPALLAQLASEISPRLLKKLDAEPQVALGWAWREDGSVETSGGEIVTLALRDGCLTSLDDLGCSCLLAPKCLHRLAVLAVLEPDEGGAEEGSEVGGDDDSVVASPPPSDALSSSQNEAVEGLWRIAVGFLQGGGQSCGVVGQGELLRAAFACREAGLYRAHASVVRVAQGARSLRADEPSFSLEAWTEAVGEMLLVAHQLRRGETDLEWLGTARRRYDEVGNLKLWGLFSEPVLTATGYAGVVTWFADSRGRLFQLSDVAPGEGERVRQAYQGGHPLNGVSLAHRELSRTRLLIQRATASSDGRLGAGQKVQGTTSGASLWSDSDLSNLWEKGPASPSDLIFVQGEVLGAERDALVLRTARGVLRLTPPSQGDLPGRDNLSLLSRLPGRSYRWIARLHRGQAFSATALAVEADRVEEWNGRCNLGCDRLHASHYEDLSARPLQLELPEEPRPFEELQRGLQRVALAGRGAARADDSLIRLWESRGQSNAAQLWRALIQAANSGERNLLGLWQPTEPDSFALSWLALHVYLDSGGQRWSAP